MELARRNCCIWRPDEEQRLQAMYKRGVSFEEIAFELEREVSAIADKLYKMKLISHKEMAAIIAEHPRRYYRKKQEKSGGVVGCKVIPEKKTWYRRMVERLF